MLTNRSQSWDNYLVGHSGTPTIRSTFMDTKRALVSVYDKTGIVDFASALIALGYEIVQSDGYEKDKPNDVRS